MKRLLNIVAVFVTLSLLIFGAFLLWNLSNQTTEVLETPQTGRVAANDVYLPLIEQGQSEGVAAISTPTAEGDVPVQVLSNPEGACLRVEDGKFLFDLVGYLENGDGTTRIIYMITNQSDETARTVSFTNEKWRIVSPQKEEKAMGVHDRYEVSVAETRQGTALTFAASQEGFTGSMEMFVMTVSDFDLKSTVDISVSTGRDDESLTEAGRAAMVLEGAPCQGSRRKSADSTPALSLNCNL